MKEKIRRHLAFTLLGTLLGACGMLVYTGPQLNDLYIEVAQLKMDNNDLQMENQSLALQFNQKTQNRTIQTVEVNVTAPDEVVALAARQYVQKQLLFLIDKPLSLLQIHPDLPLRILDGQIVHVDKFRYRIRVVTVVVGETLQLGISVTRTTS